MFVCQPHNKVARDKIGRFVRPPPALSHSSVLWATAAFPFLVSSVGGHTLFVLSLLRDMPLCHAKFPTAAKI